MTRGSVVTALLRSRAGCVAYRGTFMLRTRKGVLGVVDLPCAETGGDAPAELPSEAEASIPLVGRLWEVERSLSPH